MKIDQLIGLIRDYGRLDSATFDIVEREIRGDAMSKSTVLIVRSMFDKMEKADRSAAGRLAAQARWKGHVKQQPVAGQGGASGVAPAGVKGYQRPEVFRVKTIEAAIAMMNEGKVVELDNDDQVHTLLTELAKIANDAKAKGRDAPNYDLCKVTVPGTNLFCGENQGVPRSKMPQLRSKPVPGSEADKLPKNKWGEVEGADIFQKHLEDMGISVKRTEVPASNLKATQTDMKGTQIALMMIDPTFDPRSQEIWVTRDGYILDGHHRWAASIGSDAKDGKLGDVKMKVKMIDASISEILPLANAWTQELGLKAIAGPATDPNATGAMEPATDVQKASGGLSRWFKEDWVDLSRPKKGGGYEPCGRDDAHSGHYPKCVSAARAKSMTPEEIKSAISRKRRAESTQTREDKKPIMVETIKKENVPTNKELYARVKAEAKRKFDVYPSAYANGWLVQEYKRRGGKYKIVSKDSPMNKDVEVRKEQPLKDPKGGLTSAGRAKYNRETGSNLKPGVKGAADTPEKMKRKGSFLTRFFTNPSGPMVDDKGEPTRLALSASAWGEPVPKNRSDAARLAEKGRNLLTRYENTKDK